MIYAYNILTGYMAIRGSLFIHIPMFIAQLIFVRPPEGLGDGFEALEKSFRDWWLFSLIMHLILSLVHFLRVFSWGLPCFKDKLPTPFETVRQGFQMVAVLAETLNFALMLTLIVTTTYSFKQFDTEETLKNNIELSTYRRWITIEAGMFIVTVGSNIIVVFLRTFFKDPLGLDIDYN